MTHNISNVMMPPTGRAQPSPSPQLTLSRESEEPEPSSSPPGTGPGNRGHPYDRPSLSFTKTYRGVSDENDRRRLRSLNLTYAATAERGTLPIEPPLEYIVVLDAPAPHPQSPLIPHQFCGFCRFCVVHVVSWISQVEIYFDHMLIPRHTWAFYVQNFICGSAMEYYNSHFSQAHHAWSQFASAFIFHYLNIHDTSV